MYGYKAELVYGAARTGPCKTVEGLELPTRGRVFWPNTSRLHHYHRQRRDRC